MKTLLQFCLASFCAIVALLIQPVGAFADAEARGQLDADTDWSTFVIRRGTGVNCVNVVAGAAANPPPGVPPGAACTIATGFWPVIGLGVAGIKGPPTATGTFTNSAAAGGTTSFGTANWSYTQGNLFDTAGYSARTSILLRPAPVFPPTFLARAIAHDPVDFEATSRGLLGFEATLEELELRITDPNGESGSNAFYFFNEQELFNFRLVAPSGFSGIGDLDIFYRSALGSVFDAQMLLDIIANLTVDPVLGTVLFATPFTLFPRTEFPYDPGIHELSGGLVTSVEVAVPEPGSIVLLAVGVLVLLRKAAG